MFVWAAACVSSVGNHLARHKISKTFEGICTNSSFNLSFKLPTSKSEHQQIRAPKTVIQHFDRTIADHINTAICQYIILQSRRFEQYITRRECFLLDERFFYMPGASKIRREHMSTCARRQNMLDEKNLSTKTFKLKAILVGNIWRTIFTYKQ
mgnify:CR=1 FL=1